MQTRFRHQKQVSEWNKYSKSIATQLFYHHTPIDTAIYEKFVCCNYKLNTLTDVPYQMMVGGAFVYLCEIEQRSRVFITLSVITRFFPVYPDGRVLMELQCIKNKRFVERVAKEVSIQIITLKVEK